MMKEKNDEKLIRKLKDGLDYMDHNIDIVKPSLSQIKYLVSQVEEKKTVKKNYEFLLFLLTAVSMISASIGAYKSYAIMFIIVQAAATLVLPVGLFIWFRRYVGKVVK